MKKERLLFKHTEGTVEGIYINEGINSPLVIIVNGHNGFYNYGMFPHIQEQFAENKISSYSFNYSHGGVIGDSDRFDDLEKYEKNCMRLELEDVMAILHNIKTSGLKAHTKVFLLAHSLGGVPTVFASHKAMEENINIAGLILLSTVSTLNFYPSEMLKEWNNAGVFFKKNNRTLQELPLGFEFLQEVLKSDTTWSVKNKIEQLKIPILIIHGEKDEAVPISHGEALDQWASKENDKVEFIKLENATHTFNTKHPFLSSSIELDQVLAISISWIKTI